MALIALCRDCLARAAPAGGRCAHCGSPRLLIHPELDQLAIAHIDCDAFYAAIEKRDDPSLHDKPLIVGGGRRGVVATCCYIARESGVRSAMPMFKALALCPEAVVVRPRMARYAEVGRAIREAMLQLTPLVEPLSIDEAFLDLRGTERLHGASPAVALARFTREVEHAFGVTVSVGLSDCKLLAKIASEMDKPRGFKVIGRGEAQAVLAPLPVTAIWGVGRVAAERLRAAGLVKLADIQAIDLSEASRRPELDGGRLWRMARGLDDRPVRAERDHKRLSAETTFATDIADPEALSQALWTLCEKVSGRLKAQGVGARTVTVKLKTHDFKLRTRARALPAPTQLAGRIFDAARDLLRREATGARFRLIGVGLSDLAPAADADRGDLADQAAPRDRAREQAVDALRAKFGAGSIARGIGFTPRPRSARDRA